MLQESDNPAKNSYRVEVTLYHPPQPSQTPESMLYLDVAQVHDGANLQSGIPRLRKDLKKLAPANPAFYFELGEAYVKTGARDEAIH